MHYTEGTGGPHYTLLQYLLIPSLVLRGKKTSRKKSNSCSFSPLCAGQTSLSSLSLKQRSTSVHSNRLRDERKTRLTFTTNCTKARQHIFMETGNRERDHEHVWTSNLPLLWLPCFCPLPRSLVRLQQQTDSLAETCPDKRKSKQNEHFREAALSAMSWQSVLQSVLKCWFGSSSEMRKSLWWKRWSGLIHHPKRHHGSGECRAYL